MMIIAVILAILLVILKLIIHMFCVMVKNIKNQYKNSIIKIYILITKIINLDIIF